MLGINYNINTLSFSYEYFVSPCFSLPIKDIVFREAWTIAENTLEQVAIQASDNPIIPEAHKNDAPVVKVLEKRRKYGE